MVKMSSRRRNDASEMRRHCCRGARALVLGAGDDGGRLHSSLSVTSFLMPEKRKKRKSSWLWNQLCLSTAAAAASTEELVSLYQQQQQVLSFSNSNSLSVFCCPASVSVCYPKIAESSAKDSFLSFWSSTEAAEMVAAAAFWAFCSSTSKILFFSFTHSLTCILFARSPGALFL